MRKEKGYPMSEDKVAIRSRIADRETLILDIQGPLNSACENTLSRSFDEGMGKYKNVLLNLTDLTHMDSEGATLLLVYAAGLAQKKIGLAACRLVEPFRDVFRLTCLDKAITLFDTENEALRRRPFPTSVQPLDSAFQAYMGLLAPGWAKNVEHIAIGDVPAEAMNVNANGRKVTSPVNGFGRLWEKKYRFQIKNSGREPQKIISLWRKEFPDFWPKGNRLFTSGGAPIAPDATALLNLSMGGLLVLATGIIVIYADDDSFCFSTVRGHILCGWINFSSFREDDKTIIQVHPLFRAADPVMELGFRLGAARQEDQFWHQTLRNLASRLGVEGKVEQTNVLIDRHLRWGEIGNVWYCGAIRSSLYMPLYLLRRIFFSRKKHT
jgi:anti-anti-sigma factor